MKYLSTKKTLVLLAVNTAVAFAVWLLPSFFENMLFQKIVFFTYAVLGFVLALIFLFVNGMSTSITEGAYEKEYYSHLKNRTALDEGKNMRYNPFGLSLCRRIYYAKILMLTLLPIVLVYLFECIAILLDF